MDILLFQERCRRMLSLGDPQGEERKKTGTLPGVSVACRQGGARLHSHSRQSEHMRPVTLVSRPQPQEHHQSYPS